MFLGDRGDPAIRAAPSQSPNPKPCFPALSATGGTSDKEERFSFATPASSRGKL